MNFQPTHKFNGHTVELRVVLSHSSNYTRGGITVTLQDVPGVILGLDMHDAEHVQPGDLLIRSLGSLWHTAPASEMHRFIPIGAQLDTSTAWEDALESLFWQFDTQRKALGERLAFKQAVASFCRAQVAPTTSLATENAATAPLGGCTAPSQEPTS